MTSCFMKNLQKIVKSNQKECNMEEIFAEMDRITEKFYNEIDRLTEKLQPKQRPDIRKIVSEVTKGEQQ